MEHSRKKKSIVPLLILFLLISALFNVGQYAQSAQNQKTGGNDTIVPKNDYHTLLTCSIRNIGKDLDIHDSTLMATVCDSTMAQVTKLIKYLPKKLDRDLLVEYLNNAAIKPRVIGWE